MYRWTSTLTFAFMKKKYLDELCSLFVGIPTRAAVQLLLKDMLTPQELASMTERLQIFKLLKKHAPHRKISEHLGVSISKVTRGSHALKKSKSVISRMK